MNLEKSVFSRILFTIHYITDLTALLLSLSTLSDFRSVYLFPASQRMEAARTAVRTPSTRPAKRKASSLPSAGSLERRKRSGWVSLDVSQHLWVSAARTSFLIHNKIEYGQE